MKYYGITYNEQITSDMRVSYATAVIVGGLRNGEIKRTVSERLDILSARYKALQRLNHRMNIIKLHT